MAKFKIGYVLVPKDTSQVYIQKLRIVNVTTHYYRFTVLEIISSASFKVSKEYNLEIESIDRRYKLDQEYLDRLELQQDIKEVFNGD